jgi:hypothetical protein
MKYLFSSAKVLEMLVTVSLLLLHRHSAKRSLAVISGFPCTCVNRVSESKHNASLPSPHRPWILSPVPKKPEIYNFILFAVLVSWLCTHKHTLFLLILLLCWLTDLLFFAYTRQRNWQQEWLSCSTRLSQSSCPMSSAALLWSILILHLPWATWGVWTPVDFPPS